MLGAGIACRASGREHRRSRRAASSWSRARRWTRVTSSCSTPRRCCDRPRLAQRRRPRPRRVRLLRARPDRAAPRRRLARGRRLDERHLPERHPPRRARSGWPPGDVVRVGETELRYDDDARLGVASADRHRAQAAAQRGRLRRRAAAVRGRRRDGRRPGRRARVQPGRGGAEGRCRSPAAAARSASTS